MQPTKLWNRDFVLYWLGTAQSSFGSALAGIALSFLILELTGSAASMGVNLALSLIPGLRVVESDVECCGIAGTYGVKREKYEVASTANTFPSRAAGVSAKSGSRKRVVASSSASSR